MRNGARPPFPRYVRPARPRNLHPLALRTRSRPVRRRFYVDGQPHPFCPRVHLQKILTAAREQGYLFNVGIEPEFFLVVKNPDGSIGGWDPHQVDDLSKPCYDYKGISGALPLLRELNQALDLLGWGVYQTDHEDANFQYEVNFQYAGALTTSDRLTFFRMMAGQIAQRFGATASFMAKPFSTRTGSARTSTITLPMPPAAKICFTMKPTRAGSGSRARLSLPGGVLVHAPALCAVTSPTVNCYKRLQMGPALTGSRSGYTWTPAFISYGDNNRTQMLRVPESGHVEDRSVSSAFNPYLGLAAYLAAGLDGIERKLEPGKPNLGNLYAADLETMARRGVATLPQSLAEALAQFEKDRFIRQSLGPIADELVRLKMDEWREFHAQVDAWEIRRYLTAL